MPTDALDLARQLLESDPRTRDIALFRSAEDVLAHLDVAYAPPDPPRPLDSLRKLGFEALRSRVAEPDGVFARSFGNFRHAVLTHEETCARRLAVLRSTALTLSRLEAVAHDPARIAGMLAQLARFVAERWRVDMPLDDAPSHRTWALSVSRRYDLLPPSWRSL